MASVVADQLARLEQRRSDKAGNYRYRSLKRTVDPNGSTALFNFDRAQSLEEAELCTRNLKRNCVILRFSSVNFRTHNAIKAAYSAFLAARSLLFKAVKR